MIWRVSDVSEHEQYRLHLCQSPTGKRFFTLVMVGSDADKNPSIDAVLVSEIVPNELLKRRDVISISESVLLEGGQSFFVDAHGIWLTDSETRELDSGIDIGEIHWITDCAPIFPPR